jgi:tripartite-type tricarboxylate transporter receptor subunit TctC
VARAVREPAVRDRLAGQGLFPSGNTPEEFALQIRKEMDKMQRTAKFAKILLD